MKLALAVLLACLASVAHAALQLQGHIVGAVVHDYKTPVSELCLINSTTGLKVPGAIWKLDPPMPNPWYYFITTVYDSATDSFCYSNRDTQEIGCVNLKTSQTTIINANQSDYGGVNGFTSSNGVIYGVLGGVDILYFSIDIATATFQAYFDYSIHGTFSFENPGLGYANINNVGYLFWSVWDSTTGSLFWSITNLEAKTTTVLNKKPHQCYTNGWSTMIYYDGKLYVTDSFSMDIVTIEDPSKCYKDKDDKEIYDSFKLFPNAQSLSEPIYNPAATLFYVYVDSSVDQKYNGLFSYNWTTEKLQLIAPKSDDLDSTAVWQLVI